MWQYPPDTVPKLQLTIFLHPPPINEPEKSPILFILPPPIVENAPDAEFS